jgi:hypothetical protein
MAGLVEQLQAEALDSTKPITDLLRKALVVAKKLGIKDFETWITAELNGYVGSNLTPPEYRKVIGEIKAYNPYNNYFMPIVVDDPKISLKMRTRYLYEPISALQSLLDKTNDQLTLSFPREIEKILCDGNDETFIPKLHLSINAIHRILDTVRNNVLQWSLKLEEEGILGEGMSFNEKEKEKALTSTNIHIGNFQGVWGNVSNSSVTQNLNMTVQKGDFNSLTDFLNKKGISTEDIEELKKAITTDPKPESDNKFGEKVSSWIGKMIKKAASGAWQIGITTAGNILSTAIKAYYGL